MNLLKEKEIRNKTIHYGFSLGAYALMELATKKNLDKIILVSPSPLFKDMIGKFPKKYQKTVRKEMIKNTVSEMCAKINCEVEIYVGEKEHLLMKQTARKIAKEFGIKLNIIKGMEHDKKLFEKVLSIENGT